jgi:hypothetical protein
MIDANCTRCGEHFVPHGFSPEELIHGERFLTGKECGGIGIITGWSALQEAPQDLTSLKKFEEHGRLNPNCSDPDCEFHHPEVREFR